MSNQQSYYYNNNNQPYPSELSSYPQKRNSFQPHYSHGQGGHLSYHFYSVGTFSKDITVTYDDKSLIAYYLEFPCRFGRGWNVTLHQGSSNGPQVCQITKNSVWRGGPGFTIHGNRGWGAKLSKCGMFSKAHEFISLDGRSVYKWKTDGFFSGDWICVNTSEADEVVAKLRRTRMSFSKNGQLVIMDGYLTEQELILATALAIEEWLKEQSRNNGAVAAASSSS